MEEEVCVREKRLLNGLFSVSVLLSIKDSLEGSRLTVDCARAALRLLKAHRSSHCVHSAFQSLMSHSTRLMSMALVFFHTSANQEGYLPWRRLLTRCGLLAVDYAALPDSLWAVCCALEPAFLMSHIPKRNS